MNEYKIFWRVLAGTSVYILILVLAALTPSAAGLMLIFPTLNGLALLYTNQDRISGTTETMLWMPVVNGALCALFIFLYLMTASTSSRIWLAWALFAAILAAWVAIGKQERIQGGIPSQSQINYAVIATGLGTILFVIASLSVDRSARYALQATNIGWLPGAWQIILTNWYKIVLFATAFATFLAVTERGNLSDKRRGIFAGLPLVPFGGLVSIPGFGGDFSEQIITLKGMGVGIWLGPAVAIWFIFFISRFLGGRKPLQSSTADFWVRCAAVSFGWLCCFVMILAITDALARFA